MWYISDSNIEGVGIFTDKLIKNGEFIDLAIDSYNNITNFGSKINHSWTPNANLYKKNDLYYMVAIKDIYPHEEITANYMNTPDFIKKPNSDWK